MGLVSFPQKGKVWGRREGREGRMRKGREGRKGKRGGKGEDRRE